MSELTEGNTVQIQIVPQLPDAEKHTMSPEIWNALVLEIDSLSNRIKNKEELVPDDVARVRALRKQVDNYLTVFNKSLNDARDSYKKLVEKQLADIGYPFIEQYIDTQRKKQADQWNGIIAEKQGRLREIVSDAVNGTKFVKDTQIASGILPAFTHRFPKVNSAAKDKEIKDWSPYQAVISQTVMVLDVFFSDDAYKTARLLPIASATMQALLSYVRDGDIKHLADMKGLLEKDAGQINMAILRKEVTTKELALERISSIMEQELPADEKIKGIADIIRIAENL